MTAVDTGPHRALMDQVYRHQRHVYDLTRKYYLLGRDQLLAELDPPPGGTVLEVGCGTGRNMIALAKRRPDVRIYGLDISTEMLTTAGAKVARSGLTRRIRMAEADASTADARQVFGTTGFDRVYFSYTLSMVPDWRAALARAVDALAPGGRLHIVDFGAQEGLPRLFRAGLYRWLGLFHVSPRSAEFYQAMRILAAARRATTHQTRPFLGYAWKAILELPAGSPTPRQFD